MIAHEKVHSGSVSVLDGGDGGGGGGGGGGGDGDLNEVLGCRPRHLWRRVEVERAQEGVRDKDKDGGEEGAGSVARSFRVRTFVADELLETAVAAPAHALAAMLAQPHLPSWLRTSSAPPPLNVGVPPQRESRSERREAKS